MTSSGSKFAGARSISLGLLAILLLCLAGGVGVKMLLALGNRLDGCYKDRAPLRSFVLTMDRSGQGSLIKQTEKFANQYFLSFQSEFFTPDKQVFLLDMDRNDVEVTIANTGSDVDTYQVGFYNNDCLYPATVPDMDGLVSGLKDFINAIPGATISSEK
jgi:hypothetical protein